MKNRRLMIRRYPLENIPIIAAGLLDFVRENTNSMRLMKNRTAISLNANPWL
jgi:hypothetical protein